MNKPKNHFQSPGLFVALLIAGIAARLLLAACGHNRDMDAYREVVAIVDHGGNVYAGTVSYNYGPVWFHVLRALDLLARDNQTVFRYFVAGFLSLVDAGIFFILWRQFGRLAASVFLFNPISVIITGYHCQFDNLAVLLGLLAVSAFGNDFDQTLTRRKFFGLFILGVSLATKHILFAFPFWLAVKQKGGWQKLAVLGVPILIFALGFAPYWAEGRNGIIDNVLLYRSHTSEFFYRMFLPPFVQSMFGSQAVWLGLLLLFAFICRAKNAAESLFLYTAVLVAASPASTNQYLAIPVAFVATHLNAFTILYTLAGAWHLLVDVNGLHLTQLPGTGFIDIAFYLLALAVVWVIWRQPIIARSKKMLEWCIAEVKNQLGRPPKP